MLIQPCMDFSSSMIRTVIKPTVRGRKVQDDSLLSNLAIYSYYVILDVHAHALLEM